MTRNTTAITLAGGAANPVALGRVSRISSERGTTRPGLTLDLDRGVLEEVEGSVRKHRQRAGGRRCAGRDRTAAGRSRRAWWQQMKESTGKQSDAAVLNALNASNVVGLGLDEGEEELDEKATPVARFASAIDQLRALYKVCLSVSKSWRASLSHDSCVSHSQQEPSLDPWADTYAPTFEQKSAQGSVLYDLTVSSLSYAVTLVHR